MSKYKTDIEKIRCIAKMLLYLDIQPTRISFIASHPFTNTWVTGICGEDGSFSMVDLSNEDGRKKWREVIRKLIEKEDVFGILAMIIQQYRLFFLKEILNVISDEDLGKCISQTWTQLEYISTDLNVNGLELVSMFRRADKHTLMTEKERKYLEKMKDEVTLYRGVTPYNVRRKKAVSWTLDFKKALWFAQRYGDKGEVWKAVVPKKRILACFYDRGESEIIINLYRSNIEIQRVELKEEKWSTE